MLCIRMDNIDPFFCLAAEEYLLKNFSDEIFIIWQSTDTVVVGKHQNALAEVNYPFVKSHNIRVARRISGGGAVFHDMGNVNFTFIKNIVNREEINFSLFTQPVVNSLGQLNVTAISSGLNDLLVNGEKISGNAEHIYKNRVLHHGTLLFNSNLKNLGKALRRPTKSKYHDKAVRSRQSNVVNIYPFLNEQWTVHDFISFLFDVQLKDRETSFYKLNEKDIDAINTISEKKFKTWEWNFGYSPKYIFTNTVEIGGRKLVIKLKVERGKIIEASVWGNFFSHEESASLINSLNGKRHIYEDIRQSLDEIRNNPKGSKPEILRVKATDKLIFAFF